MKKIIISAIVLSMFAIVLASCGDSADFDSNKAIHIITREQGSGTRGAFVELFELEEKSDDGSKRELISKTANVENNTNAILTTVAADTYAIGYISMGSLNDNVKAVQIDGVDASTDNVKNGSYKISRPFNVATNGEPDGLTKDFIDFILSKEGQEIAGDSYIAVDDGTPAYAGSRPEGSITVGGSSSIAPLMEKLIEKYKSLNPNADIQLQVSDSTTGMTQTMAGVYDIGMASRALKDTEKAALNEIVIALDGIAVIVNKNNPVNNLNKDDVKKIYLGEAGNWDSFVK